MNTNFKLIGERLKKLREENNLTLEDIGNKLGMHKSTVLRWENGETNNIKLPIIETLASFYNVNPAWLAGKEVPKNAMPISIINQTKIPVLRKSKSRI